MTTLPEIIGKHAFTDTSALVTHPTEVALTPLPVLLPELAAQIERIAAFAPELATRARLAGRLVTAGAVSLSGPGEVLSSNGCYHRTAALLARVRSENGNAEFLLTREPFGGILCNCPDALPAPGDPGAPRSRLAPHTCVHILALVLQSG